MPSRTSSLDSQEKLAIILNALDEKKGVDPDVIRLEERTLIADAFVVVSGTSSLHMRSVADGVVDAMEKHALQRARREGANDANWILLDYGDVVVHIFSQEARETYNLDTLWKSIQEARAPEP